MRITVFLNEREREALRLAAERDLRDLRGQARYLIIKGLASDLVAAAEAMPSKAAQPEGGSHARQA